MQRTVRVNTEELWDAALRYERLAFNIEDIASGLQTVRSELGAASSGGDLLQRTDSMNRKADGLVYRLHDLSGKLKFAASRYEEYDRRVKTDATQRTNEP